jgi:hypothetical protein
VRPDQVHCQQAHHHACLTPEDVGGGRVW